MKKVSVIIPVWNCEKYLSQCLDSIVNQSYTNIEIIVINDGSTDSTAEICKNYANKYHNIFVIHQENCGVSQARNKGLEFATGDFISFVDADDFIDKDHILSLVESANGYDCVACGRKVFDNQKANKCELIIPLDASYTNKNEIIKAYCDNIIQTFFWGPWAILYSADIVKSVRFDTELVAAEDMVFNLNVLSKARAIATISTKSYNVRSHRDSTTKRRAFEYSPYSEHDYTLIREKIERARREFGFSEGWLLNYRKVTAPVLYFKEVTNLFCSGTPYDFRQAAKMIKNINDDEAFLRLIKENKFSSLTKAGKLSKILIGIKSSYLSAVLIKIITKLYFT